VRAALLISPAGAESPEKVEARALSGRGVKVWIRRTPPTKVRPGKRRLTEPTAAAQSRQVPLDAVEARGSDGSANFAKIG